MPQNDSTHDTFGFGPARSSAAEKIKQIKPVLPPDVHADLATVDAPATTRGLLAGKRHRMWNQTIGPSAWYEQRCESQSTCACLRLRRSILEVLRRQPVQLSEGLIEIMKRAGIPTK